MTAALSIMMFLLLVVIIMTFCFSKSREETNTTMKLIFKILGYFFLFIFSLILIPTIVKIVLY